MQLLSGRQLLVGSKGGMDGMREVRHWWHPHVTWAIPHLNTNQITAHPTASQELENTAFWSTGHTICLLCSGGALHSWCLIERCTWLFARLVWRRHNGYWNSNFMQVGAYLHWVLQWFCSQCYTWVLQEHRDCCRYSVCVIVRMCVVCVSVSVCVHLSVYPLSVSWSPQRRLISDKETCSFHWAILETPRTVRMQHWQKQSSFLRCLRRDTQHLDPWNCSDKPCLHRAQIRWPWLSLALFPST